MSGNASDMGARNRYLQKSEESEQHRFHLMHVFKILGSLFYIYFAISENF